MIGLAPRGPLQRTVEELGEIAQLSLFLRPRVSPERLSMRRGDAILALVEGYREKQARLLPSRIWALAIRFLGEVDPQLRDAVGIDRDPGRVADALLSAQENILAEIDAKRRGILAPVIPLFP